MKDWTQIFRSGSNLILPAALNGQEVKLFELNTGALETSTSADVARAVAKVYEQESPFGGPDGKPQKRLIADDITFNFAHLSQKVMGVVAQDTSMASALAHTEISGFIGANTFQVLIMHIDYRDGLVKFEYIPNRGYKFD